MGEPPVIIIHFLAMGFSHGKSQKNTFLRDTPIEGNPQIANGSFGARSLMFPAREAQVVLGQKSASFWGSSSVKRHRAKSIQESGLKSLK